MVSVTQHSLRLYQVQILHRYKFHFTLCTDTHKCRCLDIPMGCMNNTGTAKLAWYPLYYFKAECIVIFIVCHLSSYLLISLL